MSELKSWVEGGHWSTLLWLAGQVGSMGCSALPEYAAPKAGVVDTAALADSDLITYRTLTRADFLAPAPPAAAREHAEKLGALTCTFTVTTPDTSFVIDPLPDSTFSGRFDKLGFLAYMDRKCSWWNPNNEAESEAYVLQHEQIHFALTEIHARRQTLAAAKLIREFRVSTSTRESAEREIKAELSRLVDDAMEEQLELNHEFDEQTSAVRDPVVQQQWFDRVEGELAELGSR